MLVSEVGSCSITHHAQQIPLHPLHYFVITFQASLNTNTYQLPQSRLFTSKLFIGHLCADWCWQCSVQSHQSSHTLVPLIGCIVSMSISYLQIPLSVHRPQVVVCVRVDLQCFCMKQHLYYDEVCKNPLWETKQMVVVRETARLYLLRGLCMGTAYVWLTLISSSFCLWKSVMVSTSCRMLCWALLEAFWAYTSACQWHQYRTRLYILTGYE